MSAGDSLTSWNLDKIGLNLLVLWPKKIPLHRLAANYKGEVRGLWVGSYSPGLELVRKWAITVLYYPGPELKLMPGLGINNSKTARIIRRIYVYIIYYWRLFEREFLGMAQGKAYFCSSLASPAGLRNSNWSRLLFRASFSLWNLAIR